MRTLHLALIMMLGTGLALPAHAAHRITARPDKNAPPIVFKQNKSAYAADELVSTDAPIHVQLDRVPLKIDRRERYQGAVGEDGPWLDVPGMSTQTPWKSIAARQEFAVFPTKDAPPIKSWPATLDCRATGIIETPESCQRWQTIYAKCQAHTPTVGRPCYTYQSYIELRITYSDNAKPETIAIRFPGGC